jgi:UDP-GlcNAc:undecaprenyl-phosphate GlcNAc-1-phosphate transferase
MGHNWLLYISAFAASFAVCMLATPLAKKFSEKVGAMDHPKERGLQRAPIPRMGGLAIVLGFFSAMALAAVFMPELRTRQFVGFCAGALLIVALGALDDVKNLRARFKLAVQIVAALIVIFTGTTMQIVFWPVPTLLKHFDIPITIVWIIGVTNAVNLIDGVDGLAAGVSSIAALCLAGLCILSGSGMAVVFAVALAGACLGFLPYNFNPAHVFMGDTGATFLGYVLAVSSIMGVYKSYALLSVVIAVLAIALPIFDTGFAMLRRAIKGKPIMAPDREHLHHRLIDAGYSQKQTAAILYLISAAAGAVAIVIAVRDIRAAIIVAVSLLILFLIIFAYRKRVG